MDNSNCFSFSVCRISRRASRERTIVNIMNFWPEHSFYIILESAEPISRCRSLRLSPNCDHWSNILEILFNFVPVPRSLQLSHDCSRRSVIFDKDQLAQRRLRNPIEATWTFDQIRLSAGHMFLFSFYHFRFVCCLRHRTSGFFLQWKVSEHFVIARRILEKLPILAFRRDSKRASRRKYWTAMCCRSIVIARLAFWLKSYRSYRHKQDQRREKKLRLLPMGLWPSYIGFILYTLLSFRCVRRLGRNRRLGETELGEPDQQTFGFIVGLFERNRDGWVTHDAVKSDSPLRKCRLHVLRVLESELDERGIGCK